MTVRIGNAAGFLGDNLDAPRRTAEAAELDYLTLEYLAELTLSILARAREKDPTAGYARDFLDVLDSLSTVLLARPRMRIVTNAGGMNPMACASEAARRLVEMGIPDARIGLVTGDDLTGRLDEIQAAGCNLANLDTGDPLSSLAAPIVSASAYLGAREIAAALDLDARLVITGRVADASLTLGPAVHEFGWAWDAWNQLAAGSTAGHLIECGAQATGGYFTDWARVGDLGDVGYPIAELEADGGIVITKPDGTGGLVNEATVAEQLIYEIGDPAHYLTPDVEADFTTVELAEIAPHRVAVRGASGGPAPDRYKVSLAYRAGYTASGQLLIYGRDAVAKARVCTEIIRARLAAAGCEPARMHAEHLGAGDAVPGLAPRPDNPREIVLRVTVQDDRREVVERFTKEIAPLITSGPAGLAGYAAGRSPVRPVFAYWPTLVPKELVAPRLEVRTAREWAALK